LIGAEGAKTHAGVRGRGDPTGAKAPRRLPATPAESEAPRAKTTKNLNTGKQLKITLTIYLNYNKVIVIKYFLLKGSSCYNKVVIPSIHFSGFIGNIYVVSKTFTLL
jgi:hypothetical protein